MATVSVPNASDVASRWSQGASGAGNRFVTNAVNSADSWLSQASSDQAQSNYETAMQDPDVLQRRQDNTNSDAQSRYTEALNAFGAQRYSSGVNEAQDEFQNAISEVLGALDGLQIPDRGRAMSQANQDRALQVQRALNEIGGSV